MDFIDLVPESISEGRARTTLPWRADLTNSRGDIHSGTLMSVLDFTLSAAARGSVEADVGMATIDMTTSFLVARLKQFGHRGALPAPRRLDCILRRRNNQ